MKYNRDDLCYTVDFFKLKKYPDFKTLDSNFVNKVKHCKMDMLGWWIISKEQW